MKKFGLILACYRVIVKMSLSLIELYLR